MLSFKQYITEVTLQDTNTPLSAAQMAGMKKLQLIAKKDGTFDEVVVTAGNKPVTLTGVNVSVLHSLSQKGYITMKAIFLGGKCRGLKILKRVK